MNSPIDTARIVCHISINGAEPIPPRRAAILARSQFRLTLRRSLAICLAVAAIWLNGAGRVAAQTSGIWSQTASGGLWSNGVNWQGSIVASGIGASADFSQLLLPGNNTVHLNVPETIASAIFGDQGSTYSWTLDNNGSATNVLTLASFSGSPTIAVNNGTATISAVIAGKQGITLSGAGTLDLNGAAVNTYTGSTTLAGGALTLDFTNLPTPTNLVNSGSALVLSGAALTITDQPSALATLQTFGGTTLNAGASTIAVNGNGNSNANSVLALGGVTRNAGSTVNFTSLPATGNITTSTGNSNSILGGWAVVAGSDWAAVNGSSQIGTLISTGGSYTNDAWAGGNNTTVTSASNSSPIPAGSTTNSVRFSDGTADTVTLSGGVNVISSGGILVTSAVGANLSTIAGSGSLVSSDGQNDLIVNQFNTAAALLISAPLADNVLTSISLTKSGPGTLILSGKNTYSGATYIDGGTLQAGLAATVPATSAVSVFAGGSFVLGGFNQSIGSLAGAGSVTNNSNTNATLIIGNSGASTSLSGIISNTTASNTGVLSLVKAGTGNQTLTTPSGAMWAATGNGGGYDLAGPSSGTPGVVAVDGGTLTLDMSHSATQTNLINPYYALQLGGGQLALIESATSSGASQTFNGLKLLSGGSAIAVNTNGNSSSSGFVLGAITRAAPSAPIFGYGTLDFTPGSSSTGSITTTTPNGSGTILGGWATFGGGSNWAVSGSSGTNPVTALSSYTSDVWSSGNDTTVTQNDSPGSGSSTNSLRINAAGPTAGGFSVALAGANTISSGGILVTPSAGANGATISGSGTLTSGNGSDLIVQQFDSSGSLALSAPVAGAIGLTKSGPGTLFLSGASTYSGGTTINAGILSISSDGVGNNAASPLGSTLAAATPGDIVINGGTLQASGSPGNAFSLNANRGIALGPASGAGQADIDVNYPTITMTVAGILANNGASISTLTKSGPGVLALTSGASTYSGGTILSAGVLQVGASTSGSTTITSGPLGTGTLTLLGGTLQDDGSSRKLANSIIIGGIAPRISMGSSLTLDGTTLTLPATIILNSTPTLTINGAATIKDVIENSVLNGGIFKTGTGTLTFNGPAADTYSGPTTAAGGTLLLDFTNLATPTNLLNSSSELVLAGGTLAINDKPGSTATSQSFSNAGGNTTLIAGNSFIAVHVNGNTNSGSVLALGSIIRRIGSTVDFGTLPTTGTITTTTGNTNGILGGWATVAGGANWAFNNSNVVAAFGSYTNDAWASGNNTTVTGFSNSNPIPSGSTTNSLRFGSAGTDTVTLAGGVNVLSSGGILVSPSVGGNATAIAGSGALTSADTLSDLIVNQYDTSAALTISAPLVDNGPIPLSLVKSGPGSLVVSNKNSYSGNTFIDSGALQAGVAGAIPSSSAVSVSTAGTFVLSGLNQSIGSLAGGGNVTNNSSTNVSLTIGNNGVSPAFSGIISNTTASNTGTLSLIKVGSTEQTFNGTAASSSTGGTTINGGALLLDFTNMQVPVNMLNSASALTLGGGTLAMNFQPGEAATTQSFNGTMLGGAAEIDVAANGNTSSGSQLALGAIGRTTSAGTVDFILPTSGNISTTTANSAGSILGEWATVGVGSSWAVSAGTGSSAGNITALSSYQNDNFAASANNVSVTTSDAPAAFTINSLRFAAFASVLGGSTMTLSGANTIASGGILVSPSVGPGGSAIAGSGTLTSTNAAADFVVNQFDAVGTFTLGAPITGAISLTKSGPGALVLTSGASNYSGGTALSAGLLQVDAGTSGSSSIASGPLGTGTLTLLAGTLQDDGSNRTLANSLIVSGNVTLGGTLTFDGTALANPATVALTTTPTLTVNAAATIRDAISGPGFGLTKAGPGTLTLGGPAVNTYTGPTTVSGGTLLLDFSAAAAPTNLVNSTSALVLSGGTLAVNDKPGAAATLQSFNGTTVTAGNSAISVAANGNSNAASTLALGAIARNAGGTVNFNLPATGNITTTTANAAGTGILGGWATANTVNSATWAVSGGDGTNPGPISGLPASGYAVNTLGPTLNTALTANVNISANTTVNSVYFNTTSTTAGITDTTGANNVTLTINSGGILMAPNVGPTVVTPFTYGGGFIFNDPINLFVTTANPQNDLIINQLDPNGALNLNGPQMSDNAAPVALVKTGPGLVVLYTGAGNSGGTIINQGTLAIWTGLGAAPYPTPWLTFTGNGTLQYYSPGGLIPPGIPQMISRTIVVDTGATGTIDDLDSTSGQIYGANSTITGGGSIEFTSSFAVSNATFQITNQIPNSYAGTTTVLGIVLRLNYSVLFSTIGTDNSNINKLNPNNTLYLGGVLSLVGNANATFAVTNQTLGSNLNLIAGTASAIGTAAGSELPGTTFNLTGPTGAILRNAGSTLAIVPIDSVAAFHVGGGTANFSSGMLGGWATFGTVTTASPIAYSVSDWAGLNASGNIVSLTAAGGSYAANTWSAGSNTDLTASNGSPFSSVTNSLRFNPIDAAGTYTVTLAAGANTIASGGILLPTSTSAIAATLTGGSLTSGNAQDLIVEDFNTTSGSSLTIASQITGAIGLTVSGNTQTTAGNGGLVILSNGTNNYTGPTSIAAGTTLQTPAAGAIPSASAVVMSYLATLDLHGQSQSVGSLSSISFATTVTSKVAGAATFTVGNDNTSTTFNGIIINGSGVVSLVKVGTGTLTLGSTISFANEGGGVNGSYLNEVASSYSGGTTIAGGAISINADSALGSASGGLTINGTAAAPSALDATGTFSSARAINLGPATGSGLGFFDVASVYTLTLGGGIGNNGGSGGLVKLDTGTLILSNAGNTYSGGTTVTGGILNFNADTTLGATTASPNITFNGSFNSGGGTLQFAATYSGTSLSSSRSILVAAGSAGTIDTNGNNITWGGTLTVAPSGTLTKADSSGAGIFEIDSPPTLGANSALAVSGGTLRLNYGAGVSIGSGASAAVASGATLELAGSPSQLSQAVNIANAGTLLASSSGVQNVGTVLGAGNTVVNAGGSLTAYQIRQNSLTIGSGAIVSLRPSGSGSTSNPALPNNINYSSALASLSIASSGGAYTGTLDIGNNGLVIAYGSGTDPYGTIDNMIESGYNGGVWGGKGITSTLAQAGVAENISTPLNIGLLDFTPGAGNYTNTTFILFEGQTVTTNAILVRLTYMDDIVLAGDMSQNNSTSDALLFAANFGTGTTWSVGDLTHDGTIDSNDALLFAANFATGLPSLDGSTGNAAMLGGGVAAVPEPATLVLAIAAAVGLGLLARPGRARDKGPFLGVSR